MTRSDTPAPPAPAAALLVAQAQVRRGLKAGQGTLAAARTAYGEAQWSGEDDRRPEPGLLVRTRL